MSTMMTFLTLKHCNLPACGMKNICFIYIVGQKKKLDKQPLTFCMMLIIVLWRITRDSMSFWQFYCLNC